MLRLYSTPVQGPRMGMETENGAAWHVLCVVRRISGVALAARTGDWGLCDYGKLVSCVLFAVR